MYIYLSLFVKQVCPNKNIFVVGVVKKIKIICIVKTKYTYKTNKKRGVYKKINQKIIVLVFI